MASSNDTSLPKERRTSSDLMERDHAHRPSISSDPGTINPRSEGFPSSQTPTLTMDQVMVMMRENTQMMLEDQGQRMAKQMSDMVTQMQDSFRSYAQGTALKDSTGVRCQTTSVPLSRPSMTTFTNYRERPTIEEDDDGAPSSSHSSLGSALDPADHTQRQRESTFRSPPLDPRDSNDRFRDGAQRWETSVPPTAPGSTLRATVRTPATVDMDKRLDQMIMAAQKIKKYDGPVFDCVPKNGKSPTTFVDDWLIEFDRWFKIYIGDPATPGLLQSYIQVLGRATVTERDVFDWLNTRMEDNPFSSWEDVRHAISKLLMPESERMRRGTIQVVTDCDQGDTSMALYATRFNKCVKMYNLYRDKTSSSDSLSIAHSFYRGIADKAVRDRVWVRCKQDVSDLSFVQGIALDAERDASRQNVILRQGTPKTSPEIETHIVTPKSDTPSGSAKTLSSYQVPNISSATKSSDSSTTMDSLARDMQALKLLIGQGGTSRDARPNGYRGETSSSRDMSKIQCFNCHQYGHYSGKCPETPTAKTIVARNRFSAMVIQMSSPEENTEPLLSSHDVWFTKADMQDYINEQVTMVEIAREELNDEQDFHQG